MSKMLLSALILGLLVTNSFSKNDNEIYTKRDIYLLVDTLPQNQRNAIYGKYVNIGDGGKGFYTRDIEQIKDIVATLKKANKIEKELQE